MITLVPDAGPLITLAYADSLELLLLPQWRVEIVDMVLHEVSRNKTPTSKKLVQFVKKNKLPIIQTGIFTTYQQQIVMNQTPRKTGLGELAIQEYMGIFAMNSPQSTAVFLFEDHKIAKTSFYLSDNVQKISTRAFLSFLEEEHLIASAIAIEQSAIENGRAFSQMRFP